MSGGQCRVDVVEGNIYATQKVNEIHKKGIVLSLPYYSHPRKKEKDRRCSSVICTP